METREEIGEKLPLAILKGPQDKFPLYELRRHECQLHWGQLYYRL